MVVKHSSETSATTLANTSVSMSPSLEHSVWDQDQRQPKKCWVIFADFSVDVGREHSGVHCSMSRSEEMQPFGDWELFSWDIFDFGYEIFSNLSEQVEVNLLSNTVVVSQELTSNNTLNLGAQLVSSNAKASAHAAFKSHSDVILFTLGGDATGEWCRWVSSG
jgi:hypothetical protein